MKERYALVKFKPYTYEYTYKCDKSIKKGNIVRVLVAGEKEPKEVIVSRIKYLTDDQLPVSKDRIKSVLSVVKQNDDTGEFYENLDELYAFEKDPQTDVNWKKTKKCVVDCDTEGLTHKYTWVNKLDDAKLAVFTNVEGFVIMCHVGHCGYDFALTAKVRCLSKQGTKYILNKLKIAVNNYYSLDDDDEFDVYYMQDELRRYSYGYHP